MHSPASNDVIYASLAGVNPEEKNFKWTDAGGPNRKIRNINRLVYVRLTFLI